MLSSALEQQYRFVDPVRNNPDPVRVIWPNVRAAAGLQLTGRASAWCLLISTQPLPTGSSLSASGAPHRMSGKVCANFLAPVDHNNGITVL